VLRILRGEAPEPGNVFNYASLFAS
jgi:hypothetical protein